LRQRDAKKWFDVIASAEQARSVQVLKLAEAYEEDCRPAEWEPIRSALAIVPSDDGQFVTANKAVLAPEGTPVPDGRHPVAKWLYEDAEAKRILTECTKGKAA